MAFPDGDYCERKTYAAEFRVRAVGALLIGSGTGIVIAAGAIGTLWGHLGGTSSFFLIASIWCFGACMVASSLFSLRIYGMAEEAEYRALHKLLADSHPNPEELTPTYSQIAGMNATLGKPAVRAAINQVGAWSFLLGLICSLIALSILIARA
jgi:hypothetical protein